MLGSLCLLRGLNRRGLFECSFYTPLPTRLEMPVANKRSGSDVRQSHETHALYTPHPPPTRENNLCPESVVRILKPFASCTPEILKAELDNARTSLSLHTSHNRPPGMIVLVTLEQTTVPRIHF